MGMTYEQIGDMLNSTGLPCVYHHWEVGTVPPLPYIVFYYDARNDFLADNQIYKKIVSLTVELYSNEKNFEAEELVEAVLQKHHIPYSKDETYISSEKLFEQIYEMDIVLEETANGEE